MTGKILIPGFFAAVCLVLFFLDARVRLAHFSQRPKRERVAIVVSIVVFIILALICLPLLSWVDKAYLGFKFGFKSRQIVAHNILHVLAGIALVEISGFVKRLIKEDEK